MSCVRTVMFLMLLGLIGAVSKGFSAQAAPNEICSYGPVTGLCQDIHLMRAIKGNHTKLSSSRSILWIEKSYLSDREAQELHRRIDSGIRKIEETLGLAFPVQVYGQDRIEFFVHGRRKPSHTITRYRARRFLHPIVFLSFAKEKRTPYIHETVHIVAWNWHSLWLKEGLAVVLNDELGGYASFPNFGRPLDRLARSAVTGDSDEAAKALSLVGTDGVPRFGNRKIRRLFYILSGSFVKYLREHLGMAPLMKLYSADNTSLTLHEISGNPIETWKSRWLRKF